jgi:hypothetical protein
MAHGNFGTAINCMDGRVQLPVINWMKEQFHLDYVDMITEPGPDKIMASGEGQLLDSIKSRVQISSKAHGSRIIVMAGHDDCAGNPVEKEQHLAQIRQSIQTIRSWNLQFEKIIGVWINKDWKIEIL